jgi:hypothetical protein
VRVFSDYYELLGALHTHLHPDVYMEIGVHQGHSLRLATTASLAVGIDPAPDLRFTMPPGVKMAALTSDEFFGGPSCAAVLGRRTVDLAFIDGLHLFEQALRDFAHVERHCTPSSTVLVHDCVPLDAITSSRERTTAAWTGDVWKLVVCLRRHRPDLTVTTVDVAPTGLAIITALDPTSSVLLEREDELVAELLPLTYTDVAPELSRLLDVRVGTWAEVAALLPPG